MEEGIQMDNWEWMRKFIPKNNKCRKTDTALNCPWLPPSLKMGRVVTNSAYSRLYLLIQVMFKSQLHAQMNSFQAFKNNIFISIGSDNLSAIGVAYSEWLATLVFLLGELHVQRSLAGYESRGCRVRHDWATNTFFYTSLSRVRLFATPWTVACTRLLRPQDFLGKSTGVGCHFLLQGIFLTQGSNPSLPHCRQTLYRLSHQGSHLLWQYCSNGTIKQEQNGN